MFVISITYTKPASEIDSLLTAHKKFLNQQYADGVFLMSGRKVPRSGGIILADCSDRAEMEAIVESDPFYIAGVAEYEIIEFVPSMTAEALEAFRYTVDRN
ncbi:YciI family protein [Herbaspirillum robiniae]|uniref:GTP cyclohydrolase n=1 Tax=Herbaspirillum robiniae TaxID=2014887 RepID=A0A246WMT6_9BURK|nr:YciI family protein [Herbaspirillum robiniae]NUU02424.1 YciI family protein [Herbaspirillum robiniae]OWY27665.1 GTP cyclohydrolase [Herbaspirillum robiniae]